MLTVAVLLLIIGAVLLVLSVAGKLPLWPAVLLLYILAAIQIIPLK